MSEKKFKRIKLKAEDRNGGSISTVARDAQTGSYGFAERGLLSSHTPEEAVGIIMRRHPTLAMMEGWQHMVSNVGENSDCRATYIEGPPGIGKTEIGLVLAEAMGAESRLILCEKNKSLDDLIVRPLLRPEDKRSDTQKIQDKINVGEISKLGVRKLKIALSAKVLGQANDAFTEVDGKIKIDLDKVPDDKIPDVDKIIEGLIAKELPKVTGGGLGFDNVDGDLMLALKESLDLDQPDKSKRKTKPMVIMIDEFSRRGDDGSLQHFFEAISGDKRVASLTDAKGVKHEITAQQLKDAGTYFIFSANMRREDDKVMDMPPALQRRLKPITIRDYGVSDFRHSLERAIMGVPLSTIRMAGKQNPIYHQQTQTEDGLRDLGLDIRDLGRGDEASPLPDSQISFIHNHVKVAKGLMKVAELFDEWRSIEDPNSTYYKGNPVTTTDAEAKVRADVVSSKKAQLGLAARKYKEDPRGVPSTPDMSIGIALDLVRKSWENAIRPDDLPQLIRKEDEPLEERFGDFLVFRIHEFINQRYPDPDNVIRLHLEKRMLELGALPEEQINAAKKRLTDKGQVVSDVATETLPALLNTNPPLRASEQATGWRDALVDFLKQKYKDTEHHINADTPPAGVLSDVAVDALLKRMPEELEQHVKDLGPIAKTLPLIFAQSQEDEHTKKVTKRVGIGEMQAFDLIMMHSREMKDAIAQGNEVTGALPGPDAKRVIMTLALPGAMDKVGDHLFMAGYSKHVATKKGSDHEEFYMMENKSPSGLAITTLRTEEREDGDAEVLQVIKHTNKKTGNSTMLIVGDHALGGDPKEDHKLRSRLKAANITYVARSDENARNAVESKIEMLATLGKQELGNSPQADQLDLKLLLSRTFRHRNPVVPELIEKAAAFHGKAPGELFIEQDVIPGKTIADLLLEPELTITKWPVVLRDKMLETVECGSHAAAAGAAKPNAQHTK